MKHYIDTSTVDLSRARTVGLTNLLPQPFPVLIAGRKSTHQFFFADNGTVETWSGLGTYGLRVTIGNTVSVPIASTWSLTIGATVLTLPFDINAAGLQNALNANATVSAQGGVYVVGEVGNFLVLFKQLGVVTAWTIDDALLGPDCTAVLTTLATGSASVRQMSTITLAQTTPLQTTTFSTITSPQNGWSGVINLTGSNVAQLMWQFAKENGPYLETQSVLTVEVIDPDGNATPYYQTEILLRALNYPATVTQNTPSAIGTGPTRNSQTSSVAGTVTITPLSMLHTEVVSFTGSANTRNLVVGNSGLSAGAQISILCLFDGVANGVVINIYALSASGTKMYTFTKAGDELNALFTLVSTTSTFEQGLETIPAFTAP